MSNPLAKESISSRRDKFRQILNPKYNVKFLILKLLIYEYSTIRITQVATSYYRKITDPKKFKIEEELIM